LGVYNGAKNCHSEYMVVSKSSYNCGCIFKWGAVSQCCCRMCCLLPLCAWVGSDCMFGHVVCEGCSI